MVLSQYWRTDGQIVQQTDATQLQHSRPASRAGNAAPVAAQMTLSTCSKAPEAGQGPETTISWLGFMMTEKKLWSHSCLKVQQMMHLTKHPAAAENQEVFSKQWRKLNCRFMFSWWDDFCRLWTVEMMTANKSCCCCPSHAAANISLLWTRQ